METREDIEIGPLTLPQLKSLARDATSQLRRFWAEIFAREPQTDSESVLMLLEMLQSALDAECRK